MAKKDTGKGTGPAADAKLPGGDTSGGKKGDTQPSAAEKKSARASFTARMAEVKKTEVFCQQEGWQKLHAFMLKGMEQARAELETCEKADEMRRCQERIKAYGAVIDEVRRPVDQLDDLQKQMPLFADGFTHQARWDEKTGKPVISPRKK